MIKINLFVKNNVSLTSKRIPPLSLSFYHCVYVCLSVSLSLSLSLSVCLSVCLSVTHTNTRTHTHTYTHFLSISNKDFLDRILILKIYIKLQFLFFYRPKLLSLAVLIFSLSGTLMGIATEYWHLVILRMLIALG